MADVTFYGGVGEIGGNKILLCDEDEGRGGRIFLDFGMSFKQHGRYFSEFIQPRTSNGLNDFFELGLLPDMKGLYRNDYLRHNKRETSAKPAVDGVLLTHAHMDHMGYVNFLHEDCNVYSTPVTRDICSVFDETGSGSHSDFVKTTKCFSYYENSKGAMSRIKHCKDPDIKKKARSYPIKENGVREFDAGGMRCRLLPLDHSLPGSCGFLIECDGAAVAYTGDLRFHGKSPERTRRFIKACASSKPDLLICEGTNIDEEPGLSEDDVETRISQAIAEAGKNHLFATFPVRDTDRLMSFYRAAIGNERKLAVNLKQAFLLDRLAESGSLASGKEVVPSRDPHLAVYAKKKDYGLIGGDADTDEKKRDYDVWEREFIGQDNCICWKDMRERPEDYVLYLDSFSIQELVDIKPLSGSLYIKSSCEPFDLEMELDWKRMLNWFSHFGLRHTQIHASGHACGSELLEMVREIAPKRVMPVHTEKPGLFKEALAGEMEVLPPELNKVYGV